MALLAGAVGCKPNLVVGEFQCTGASDGAATSSDPVVLPWKTSFENGPCDYYKVGGSCYRFPPIDFRLVDAPVHSGNYAVEITVVTGTDGGTQPQGRCIRVGAFPVEAYYGAWYLIPAGTTKEGLWNLLHFGTDKTGLWDVHAGHKDSADPTPVLQVYSRLQGTRFSEPVPIGRWFHLVFYLKRAKNATGAVALYLGDDQQSDRKILEITNIATEDDDLAQWYVGNLASETTPPKVTVYVDDVSILSTP